MKIILVGAGRLGRSFAVALAALGHEVTLVRRGEAIPAGPLTLLTVPDRAIALVSEAVPREGVLLHCAGALSHEVLRPHPRCGCLHPLMSYPGPEVSPPQFTGVPAAVEGDPEAEDAAQALAISLGMIPFQAPEDRALYHAAAVLAGNLLPAIFLEAAEVLHRALGAPHAERLLPLARAALENAAVNGRKALTGPASRGDTGTIERHIAAMCASGLNSEADLYEILSSRVTQRTREP